MTGLRTILNALMFCLLAACATATTAPETAPAPAVTAQSDNIVAAVADARRPQEDRDRDAVRKPAEITAFAQLEAGDVVADVFPGGGYFTRVFSVAVGEGGRVYAVVPAERFAAPIQALAPQYPNVTMLQQSFQELAFPAPADVIFTSQNYHDFHIARYNIDAAAVNRSVFNALKPGGLYVVIDHAAVAGTDLTVPEALHRIDEAIVRQEVEAAGFVYDGSSDALRNPADPRTAVVFDPSIRGHTDQFALRFRKPR